MCGACGGAGPDWSLQFVSGPQRRAAIAKLLTTICRGIAVGTMRQGWTVRTATGGWSVAQTLDELVDATARWLVCGSWRELETAVVAYSGGAAEEHGEWRPTRSRSGASHVDGDPGVGPAASPRPVLTMNGDLHLRLVAFALGVRTFETGSVALDAPDRGAPFRLVAAGGRILGAVDLPALQGAAAASALIAHP